MFSTIDELLETNLSNSFCVPYQTNHTSVDFYVPEKGLMVQVTVGQKHGVKGHVGLEKGEALFQDWIMGGIASDPEDDSSVPDTIEPKIRVVFLCDKYNQFGRQNWFSQKGLAYQRNAEPARLNDRFEQYAWCLDLETQLGVRHREA